MGAQWHRVEQNNRQGSKSTDTVFAFSCGGTATPPSNNLYEKRKAQMLGLWQVFHLMDRSVKTSNSTSDLTGTWVYYEHSEIKLHTAVMTPVPKSLSGNLAAAQQGKGRRRQRPEVSAPS